MEEEINRVPILRNKLLANDLESNNGETVNFQSQNLSLQTIISKGTHHEHPIRPEMTSDRTGKKFLKLPQSSSNNDIKLDHHHNQKGVINECIVQWNIDSQRNNFEELKTLTEELDPTIVCLQETHVKP
jgi:hypothetical protein